MKIHVLKNEKKLKELEQDSAKHLKARKTMNLKEKLCYLRNEKVFWVYKPIKKYHVFNKKATTISTFYIIPYDADYLAYIFSILKFLRHVQCIHCINK